MFHVSYNIATPELQYLNQLAYFHAQKFKVSLLLLICLVVHVLMNIVEGNDKPPGVHPPPNSQPPTNGRLLSRSASIRAHGRRV